jgi:hypothetical protein
MPRRCAACSTERVAVSDDVISGAKPRDVPDLLPGPVVRLSTVVSLPGGA